MEEILIHEDDKKYSFAVISDLHIGLTDEKNNDYYLDNATTIRLFDAIYKHADTLVLNGDIFECWEADFVLDQNYKDRIDKLMKNRKEIFDYITEKCKTGKMIYIMGNHDGYIYKFRKMEGLVAKYERSPLLIAHGNQVDLPNRSYDSFFGRCITCCVGKGEKTIYENLDVQLSNLLHYTHNDKVYEDSAKEFSELGFTCVVYGHTHKAYVKELSKKCVYANTGCWRDKKDNFDVILIAENCVAYKYLTLQGELIDPTISSWSMVD